MMRHAMSNADMIPAGKREGHMSNFERSIERGCSALVNAMLHIEETEGQHEEIEFTFEFEKIDYKITVARIGHLEKAIGSLNA